jgi:hypothetical protein
MIKVPVNCFHCGERHELEKHIWNNIFWDNQDVLCAKCGKKLSVKPPSKVATVLPQEYDTTVYKTNVDDEPPQKKSDDNGGTFMFVVWYVFALVCAPIFFGVEGFAFVTAPIAVIGFGWLMYKITDWFN